MSTPDFFAMDLAGAVERMSAAEIDALPFGAIRVDAAGEVMLYSAAERALSGYAGKPVGKSFFAEIAPCMNVPDFRGRIERALAMGSLDIEFEYVGDFADAGRKITVRIQSAAGGGYWIFMKR